MPNDMKKKYYITTPIYYVNSKPHIGHSYTQIACDTVARFMRQAGGDVLFMTGTDEHGEKIEKAAIDAGLKAGQEQKFVDGIVSMFKDVWVKLDIQYDTFIRTTDAYHIEAVRAFLDKLYKDGKIYKKDYKGWFCTPCETFWTQTQSPDGICPECKRPLEKLDETNYFLKTSEYQKWLIEYIDKNPDFIKPDFRKNEILGFLKNEELMDLCVTRPKARMSWGVEVPFDKDYVAYVWFDALINYISGIGYPGDMKRFNEVWPADAHVIGKDIIRHHAVYWAIMLHAAGLPLPKTIFAHGWWIMKGEKMSKSKGNVVDPLDLINKYGVDAYRYFLLREVQFGADGAFSEEALVARFNSDLANDLGNLLNRTLTMVEKYFDRQLPVVKCQSSVKSGGENIRAKIQALPMELEKAIPNFDFAGALIKIWEVIGLANKYIEDSKPWTLAKENKTDELAAVMTVLLEALNAAAVSIAPFMPQTSIKIQTQLKSGIPTPIFPRIETKP